MLTIKKKVKIFTKNKKYFLGIISMFFLSIILTVLEALGIASITSMVTILSNSNNYIFELFFDQNTEWDLKQILTIIVIIFFFKSLFQIIYNFIQSKLSAAMNISFTKNLFEKFINSSYELSLFKNPSELIRKISSDVNISISYIFMILLIIKEILILFAILFLLFFTKTNVVILVFVLFGSISIIFYKSVRNQLTKLATRFIKSQTESIKLINQAFGSLKENIILDLRKTLIKKFSLRITQVQNFEFFRSFIKSIPRVLFELVAIIVIIIIAYVFLLMDKKMDYILQALTLIGICSVRLIPSFNALTNSFSVIKSFNEIFNGFCEDIYFFENLKKNKYYKISKKFNFNTSIELKNVSFKYPKTKKNIINKANLVIKKGYSIGIHGRSGSGKTTLVDIIIGLLEKTSGEIKIDNKDIKNNKIKFNKNEVGYVPQSPYLMDDTIENNILFGRNLKNKKKYINNSIKLSQIEKFISELPKGLKTYVGNNGSRLSGGQKQRIVIARALLFKPELIIFDEATSALDSTTEKELIKEIYKLKKITTLIIISHKKEIINKCDYKYKIKNNKLHKSS